MTESVFNGGAINIKKNEIPLVVIKISAISAKQTNKHFRLIILLQIDTYY